MTSPQDAMNRRRFLTSSASGMAGAGVLAGWDGLLAAGAGDGNEGTSASAGSQARSGATGGRRTLVRGRWVVGFDGREHRLIDDGVVVYEADRIVHVGRSYEGDVDEVIDASGRLVIPGLVNIHAVSNIDIVHFRIDGLGQGARPSRVSARSTVSPIRARTSRVTSFARARGSPSPVC